jgi:hypothetical protein
VQKVVAILIVLIAALFVPSGGSLGAATTGGADALQDLITRASCTGCALSGGKTTLARPYLYHGPSSHRADGSPCKGSPDLDDMGNQGPQAIFGSWSAGTYDPDHDQMLMWGGGHTEYAGNEVYALPLKTLTWRMLDCPSSLAGFKAGDHIYPDRRPVSRHTYGGNSYRPGEGMITTSGAPYPLGQCSLPETWIYDPVATSWTQKTAMSSSDCGAMSVYNPADNRTYYFSGNRSIGFKSYSAATGSWTNITFTNLGNGTQNGDIDPVNGEFIGLGANQSGAGYDKVTLSFGAFFAPAVTGSNDCLSHSIEAPGFVYWKPHKFIAWCGGNIIDAIDTNHAGTSGDPFISTRHAITGPALPRQNALGEWKSVALIPGRSVPVLCIITFPDNVVFFILLDPSW